MFPPFSSSSPPSSPFCLLQEKNSPLLLLRGTLRTHRRLDEIELPPAPADSPPPPPPVVAPRHYHCLCLVPFAQLAEVGCRVHSEPEDLLRCLYVEQQEEVDLLGSWTSTSSNQVEVVEGSEGFDISEPQYEQIVADVLRDQILNGEGSSFVVSREYCAKLKDFSVQTALTIFRRILDKEFGCYWRYLFYDGERCFICASPERHLTVQRSEVRMNPISGTYRKTVGTAATELKQELDAFLSDAKEVDELFMVTDEELKMMCRICPKGGCVEGPFLKEMPHVVHSEYELRGVLAENNASLIDAFRLSMFAPTVTGSPMKNAVDTIYSYETSTRRYYSGALMALGTQAGQQFLDSCINIRMQVVVGATDFACS
eukprot:GHVS01088491.1.p1 GENE.GHVS01088491.1~~GHVS01088491.1.p1  ORF type:complete len:371 (-),score=71.22 GHVS01088491.1:1268-2380(-)